MGANGELLNDVFHPDLEVNEARALPSWARSPGSRHAGREQVAGFEDRSKTRVKEDPHADAMAADNGWAARGVAAGSEGLPSAPATLAKETLVVFDWDDTLLPTSWLQRIHNLSGGFMLGQESQALLTSLTTACAETLALAASMGTVILITNSVPGWVDQSCQLFMPQLLEHVKKFPIVARPMRAPLTFKTSAFQREFKMFRNLISVGDGNAERTATLRLQMAPEGGFGNVEARELPRSVKSVKLMEAPTIQQLSAQHEMLQQRLVDIVGYRGHLDLKSRFLNGSGPGFTQPLGKVGTAQGSACTLVHFARTLGQDDKQGIYDSSRMQGFLYSRTITPTSRAGESSGTSTGNLVAERGGNVAAGTGINGVRALGRQLPLLGGGESPGVRKNASDVVDGSVPASPERIRPDERNVELDGGTEAADALLQAMSGSLGDAATPESNETDANGRSMCVAEEHLVHEDRIEQRGSGTEAAGPPLAALGVGCARRSVTPSGPGGHWKVERGSGRSPWKKRPPLERIKSSSAVWRENSAPAATRGF